VSKQEKFIILIITLVIIGRFGGLAKDLFIAQYYGAGGLSAAHEQLWYLASAILNGLINIGASIWLYFEANEVKLKAWVWALFGLFFGLIGVAIFYLVQIYTSLMNQKITNKQSNIKSHTD